MRFLYKLAHEELRIAILSLRITKEAPIKCHREKFTATTVPAMFAQKRLSRARASQHKHHQLNAKLDVLSILKIGATDSGGRLKAIVRKMQ